MADKEVNLFEHLQIVQVTGQRYFKACRFEFPRYRSRIISSLLKLVNVDVVVIAHNQSHTLTFSSVNIWQTENA